MNAQFPRRPRAHVLAETSERYFRGCLPPEWRRETPQSDYGADLRVGIVDGDQVTGMELIVQLKAAERSNEQRGVEKLRISSTTYNYLRNQLNVVMFVKYVEAEAQAYWVLLRDIDGPAPGAETMTVRVPRLQTLTTIDWPMIRERVREVHDGKLAAGL